MTVCETAHKNRTEVPSLKWNKVSHTVVVVVVVVEIVLKRQK